MMKYNEYTTDQLRNNYYFRAVRINSVLQTTYVNDLRENIKQGFIVNRSKFDVEDLDCTQNKHLVRSVLENRAAHYSFTTCLDTACGYGNGNKHGVLSQDNMLFYDFTEIHKNKRLDDDLWEKTHCIFALLPRNNLARTPLVTFEEFYLLDLEIQYGADFSTAVVDEEYHLVLSKKERSITGYYIIPYNSNLKIIHVFKRNDREQIEAKLFPKSL